MHCTQPVFTPAQALPLHPHPASGWPKDCSILSDIERCARYIRVHYQLGAPANSLRIPAVTDSPQRLDGLWQHTCCEMFIADADSASYTELNFSPSGDWAAYRFDDYRQAAATTPEGPAPTIKTEFNHDKLILSATIAREMLPASAGWHIGLNCVLEHADGSFSYWALHHPGPRPDFHLRAGFTLSHPH